MRLAGLAVFATLLFCRLAGAADKPNVVLIYGDDVGWGDLGAYGATQVKTPNLDRLAKEGLRFTDGHTTSATCTPSRYAMLTGEYPWRKKGTGILPGDGKLIIEPGRTTLPSIFQKAGYVTGVVGKWHLGLGGDKQDWNGEITPGPREIGFSYSFILPATGDRVPCVYLENQRIVNLDPKDPLQVGFKTKVGDEPTGVEHPELLKMHPSHGHDQTIVNGISRIGYMTGAKAARWVDEDMADVLTKKATAFIEAHKAERFFLYYATHDIHVPRVPHPRFVGKTGMGPRGDVIVQLDWAVGEVLKTLDRLKLTGKTIVMFSSDNGPVIDDGYKDQAVEKLGGHKPAGPYRGGKYSAFEGGTRVPFIVRWPGQIKPGTSDALVSQVDFAASFAALTGGKLGDADAPDSFDVSAALLGKSKTGRDHVVEHAGVLSLRKGPWKLIEAGSGPKVLKATNTEMGAAAQPQLYAASDVAERNDVAAQHADVVKALSAQLEKIRSDIRSRP